MPELPPVRRAIIVTVQLVEDPGLAEIAARCRRGRYCISKNAPLAWLTLDRSARVITLYPLMNCNLRAARLRNNLVTIRENCRQ